MNRKTVIEFSPTESLQDQAATWVSKLDVHKPSKATVVEFKQWLKQSPEHRQMFEKHLALWNDMNVLTGMVPPSQSELHQAKGAPAFFAPYRWQGLAFALLLFVFVGFQFSHNPGDIYQTAIGEQKTVQLEDGTLLLLNTHTEVKVEYSADSRSVYLNYGEAHFDVAHNPEVPFEVFAGKGKVRAVGTAFTVYLKSDDVEVVVTEGVVAIIPTDTTDANPSALSDASVSDPKMPPPLAQLKTPETVSAGNVATYDRHTAEHVIQTALGEDTQKLSWHQGLLVFRNEALEVVIEEVNRYTELKIVIPDKNVRAMKVGGFFKVTDINSVFDALEKGFDIHAEVVSDGLVYLVHNEK